MKMFRLYTLRFFKIFCCAVLVVFINNKGNTQNFSFEFQSINRSYIVHLPAGYSASNVYPLVLNYHGYTSNAAQQQVYTNMDAVADSNQFIVVYPDGVNNSWNVGFGVGAYGTGVDDVGFTSALIDTLLNDYSIDPNRIYACGMSNGGYMSYRLACELENRIAAIASVTGLMTDSTAFHCSTSRNVPVMQIHGTADPIVNYNGLLQSLGVEATMTFWFSNNGCSVPADSLNFSNINTTDNSTIERIWYSSCGNGSEVMFYKIMNGGHTWPGAIIDIPAYGNTNRDVNASADIWRFFNRFTLNGPAGIDQIFDEEKVVVFPNPFNNQLSVSSDKMIKSIRLCDLSGKCILTVNNMNSINTQSINPGIYILRIETNESVSFVKVLKN